MASLATRYLCNGSTAERGPTAQGSNPLRGLSRRLFGRSCWSTSSLPFGFLFFSLSAWLYSWIADPQDAHKKLICQSTSRVTSLSRPALESSRRGESRSTGFIFVWPILTSFFKITFQTSNAQTKTVPTESDSTRWTLSCQDLRSFWGASACWQLDFLVV